MDYEVVRRIVTQEVLKHLGTIKSNVRVRRPVVTEAMIVSARRRGSDSVNVTPGSLITPAAAERAKNLNIHIKESNLPSRATPESNAVIEAVMAAVIAELEKRPRAKARPSGHSKKLLTAEDIALAHERQVKSISLGKSARVTPLAIDLARSHGIKIQRIG